jgi:esterase
MSAVAEHRGETLRLAHSDPRGSGEPILFVHGFSHNRVVWDDVMGALPERWRPISVDLRGHGESDWSTTADYALTDYAMDLSAFLDSIDVRGAHVVGHSLGGNVCTLFAADCPGRVRSLSLVDTGPTLAAASAAHIAGEVGESLRSYASVEAFRAQLALIHPLGDSRLLDRLARSSLVQRIDGYYELALDPGVLGMASVLVDLDAIEGELWAALSALSCPVLVLRGALSSILSEEVAEEMVNRRLSFGRLETLPGAGHAIMLDDPQGLRDQLLRFLV